MPGQGADPVGAAGPAGQERQLDNGQPVEAGPELLEQAALAGHLALAVPGLGDQRRQGRPVKLGPGMSLDGPALIVEDGTTTVVPQGFSARINALGQIVLEDRA